MTFVIVEPQDALAAQVRHVKTSDRDCVQEEDSALTRVSITGSLDILKR